MATLEEIVVELTAETSKLRAELNGAAKAVQQSTEKMDDAIKSFADNSSKKTSFFQQTMATMTGFLGSQVVLGAFNALKGAVSGFVGELQEGIQAAAAEEQALTRLGNSLLQNGRYTDQAFKSLADFAGQMEELTGVSDDVVASNLAMLSSMTKLDEQGLKTAQKAALDLAAAYNMDLDTATRTVAKSIDGQEGALKKLGIEVSLTSDKTQNFANVMQALSGVNGQAEAKMKTFGGAVTGLQNSWGNLVESIANAITKNQVVIAVISEAGKILSGFTKQIADGGPALRDGLGAALLDMIDTLMLVAQAGDLMWRTLKGVFNGLQTAVGAVVESILFLYSKISGTEIDNPFEQTQKNWDETKSSFTDDTVLTTMQEKLGQLRAAGSSAFKDMAGSAMESVPAINAAAASIANVNALTDAQLEKLKAFATGLAEQGMALDAQYQYESAALEAKLANEEITQQEYYTNLQAIKDEQYMTDQANLAAYYAGNTALTAEYEAARTALANQHANDQKKIEAQKNKDREQNFKSTMGTIATLAQSSNNELASIGKAAAITQATIDGYAAVQKAMASAPPPFNFALAAMVGAATAANVAKIAGTPLKSGIDEVPGMGDKDNFPAILAPGERVVPSETNKDLKEFLDRQGGGGTNINITVNVQPGTGISREGAAEIVEAMNNYFAAGGIRLIGAT